MSNLNNTIVYQVSVPSNSSQYQSLSPPTTDVQSVLSQIWSLITIWRLLVAFLLIGNIKNIPLIWHVGTSLHRRAFSIWQDFHRCGSSMLSGSAFGLKDQRSLLHMSNCSDHLSPRHMLHWWKSISIYTVCPYCHPPGTLLTSIWRNELVLLLRHRHRSHASCMHPLLHWHRTHAWRDSCHNRSQTSHLRSRSRCRELFIQTWTQAIWILWTMDSSLVLGREVDLHCHTLRSKGGRLAKKIHSISSTELSRPRRYQATR